MKYIKRKREEAGLTMVFGALALVALITMLGLVVDVGFVYGAKTQLQASVDGLRWDGKAGRRWRVLRSQLGRHRSLALQSQSCPQSETKWRRVSRRPFVL